MHVRVFPHLLVCALTATLLAGCGFSTVDASTHPNDTGANLALSEQDKWTTWESANLKASYPSQWSVESENSESGTITINVPYGTRTGYIIGISMTPISIFDDINDAIKYLNVGKDALLHDATIDDVITSDVGDAIKARLLFHYADSGAQGIMDCYFFADRMEAAFIAGTPDAFEECADQINDLLDHVTLMNTSAPKFSGGVSKEANSSDDDEAEDDSEAEESTQQVDDGDRSQTSQSLVNPEELEKQLNRKLPVENAWTAVQQYGKKEYPYGFKTDLLFGVLTEEPRDADTWSLKCKVKITNEYGATAETTVEASVTGTEDNPRVIYFYVYPV